MRPQQAALLAVLAAQPILGLEQATLRQHVDENHAQVDGPGVNILTKMADLVSLGEQVCITLNEYYQIGDFSETMGLVNAVMNFAQQHSQKVTFVMPEIIPPARKTGDDFRFIFGEPALDSARWNTMYTATCPFQSDNENVNTTTCSMDDLTTFQNTVYLRSRIGPECTSVIMVSSSIFAAYDYTSTGPMLSEMYRQRRGDYFASTELHFPITAALHLRVGEGEGTGFLADVSSNELQGIMSGLLSMLDPKCLKVELHSDVAQSNANMEAMVAPWKSQHFDDVQVRGLSTKANEAFDSMAAATILIGGASGLARLAAVVGKARMKIFVDDSAPTSHPIGFLSDVTTVKRSMINQPGAVQEVIMNSMRVRELKDQCNAWLSK